MPVLPAEEMEEEGGQQHHGSNAPGVGRVELAHLPVRVRGGDGGDDGAEQHLRQTAGGREDHRTHQQPQVCGAGEEQGPQAVDTETQRRQQGTEADHLRNVEELGPEGKQQIHQKLGHEIDADQCTQGGIGYAEALPEGQEQHRAEIDENGHRQAEGIAADLQAAVSIVHKENSLPIFYHHTMKEF